MILVVTVQGFDQVKAMERDNGLSVRDKFCLMR